MSAIYGLEKFSHLEDKIYRTIEQFKRERQEREALEREVLSLISEGCSNKQGALRMNISPRTFESHRAEAMRKLGARNTADLVRKALLQPA